ncbi:aminoglycoside phosphotransferase family protein [Kribbella sp. NPDC003557]|uniref:phosphotransferase family protein n=1 Tax=Kribbella sp. NPDC003557 TaxID=3154449 RepID=UPI0033B934B6
MTAEGASGLTGPVEFESLGRSIGAGERALPEWFEGEPKRTAIFTAQSKLEMVAPSLDLVRFSVRKMASTGRGKVPGCRHGCARGEIGVVATSHPGGDRPFDPMSQGKHPEKLPIDVLDDVARVVGAEVALLSRLPGGFDVGALRVQLAGRAEAVLKAWPRTRPNQLDEVLRAQRVVEHMRRRGYPTPACLGVGATATHVWHLMDFVDATPAQELTPSIVEQLMEITELQAGQASEPYDHWSYAWRLATGQESGQDLAPSLSRAVADLSGYSSVVSALVERLRLMCADVPAPREAPDMVHADFNPNNVLVRNGAVVAVVDIGNAGSGTRATDLTTLQWHTFQDPRLDGVRRRLRTRILDLVDWEGAAVLAATQILTQLEWPIRHGHHDVVPGVVKRGHRALDELNTLR